LLPRSEVASTREQLHDARGRAWILANGGTLPYDLRLVAELPSVAGDGFARIEVRRTRAGAAPLLLHSMPSRRSRFDDFTAHVTPARGRLSAGFAPRPAGEPSSRVDVAEAGVVWAPGAPVETTRDGLPPPTWVFPPAIQANLAPIDESATARFVRLAHEGAVPGLFEPVAATDVQSLLDEAGHLVALWWRTPEPLDWRRLDAWIRVRGPTELPYVPTFTARLSVVPSPDGSGAFLIAMRGDHGVFIPRGRASVTLSYQMQVPGVVPLALPVVVGETTIVDLELPLGWALARAAGG
jgi:hypothetical protein